MYVLFKLSQYVKGMGIFVKFDYFYNARSPNMVMSLDPKSKLRFDFFKMFFLNSSFNIGESHKSFSGKALYF